MAPGRTGSYPLIVDDGSLCFGAAVRTAGAVGRSSDGQGMAKRYELVSWILTWLRLIHVCLQDVEERRREVKEQETSVTAARVRLQGLSSALRKVDGGVRTWWGTIEADEGVNWDKRSGTRD